MSRSLDESSRSHNTAGDLKRQATSLQYSAVSKSEGYDEHFDPPLENKYECPICLLGLREPVQTSCGHRFCNGCIRRSLRDAGNKCPVDNEHLTESGLYPDNFAKREMNSFPVWCRNKKEKGCPWKGPLKDLEEHLKTCSFSDVKCPNLCGMKVQLRELENHMEKSCPKRKIRCPFCHLDVYVTEADGHSAECPEMPINCEKCGMKDILRKQMAGHLETKCPKVRSKCPLFFLGCSFEGYNPDVSKHIEEFNVQHFKDIAKAVKKLQEERPVTSAIVRSAGPSTSHEEPSRAEARHVSGQPSAGLRDVINRLDKLEERVIELEGRVSAGTFIWKIENFRHCRAQAIDNVVPAIHSPPFYTSLYGYKMCLRINLNGVDSGLGHHISLFVHMMKGDWDDILEWPFTGRITLAILDQSENVEFRRPISETLVAKPNLLAFQKPTTARNHKGYGYVEFCQIEQLLHDAQFVSKDTMLVRIQVFH